MFENMRTDFILREKCLNTEFCLEAVNYYHKALHLGCCSSPRSASAFYENIERHLTINCFCKKLHHRYMHL